MAGRGRRDSLFWRVWLPYRLRWKRRELRRRALRSARDLTPVTDRTADIRNGDILCFITLRNECARLPEFLAHYRGLGVDHFLVVDNESTDGGDTLLRGQPDVSLWQTAASYRGARFGMDWLGALLHRHGNGHWCLTVDADELLIYPDWDRRGLRDLTRHLDRRRIRAMGALMLDLYQRGSVDDADAPEGSALTQRLPYYDAGPYRSRTIWPRRNRWVQGGVRERAFFADAPHRSPTLNKLPLIRWSGRFVYVNSTHSALPPYLNDAYDGPGDPRLSGVLLHGKFLPGIAQRSSEELERRQHFHDPEAFADYHRHLTTGPVLWHPGSARYQGWQQLLDQGLMGAGDWLEGSGLRDQGTCQKAAGGSFDREGPQNSDEPDQR